MFASPQLTVNCNALGQAIQMRPEGCSSRATTLVEGTDLSQPIDSGRARSCVSLELGNKLRAPRMPHLNWTRRTSTVEQNLIDRTPK